jgi:hypothetical protein
VIIKAPGVPAVSVNSRIAGYDFAGTFLYQVTDGLELKRSPELANEGWLGSLDGTDFETIGQQYTI